jgi:hypothetical protein
MDVRLAATPIKTAGMPDRALSKRENRLRITLTLVSLAAATGGPPFSPLTRSFHSIAAFLRSRRTLPTIPRASTLQKPYFREDHFSGGRPRGFADAATAGRDHHYFSYVVVLSVVLCKFDCLVFEPNVDLPSQQRSIRRSLPGSAKFDLRATRLSAISYFAQRRSSHH